MIQTKIPNQSLRKLREANNFSRQQLCKKLGVKESQLSLLESGNRNLTLNNFFKLSKIFNLTLDETADRLGLKKARKKK